METALIVVLRIGFVAIAIGLVMLMIYLFLWRPNRKVVSYDGQLLTQVNAVRQKKRNRPLGRTKLLDSIAADHSRRMAQHKQCSHIGIDNRAKTIRRRTGLSRISENCAMVPAPKYDSHTGKQLVDGWLKSPRHRDNLLEPRFRRTGIGISVRDGYVYATQIFTN